MFKQKIILLIAKQTGLIEDDIEKVLEIPPSFELGDYAFPCFILSKKLKKSSNEIAQELAKKLREDTSEQFREANENKYRARLRIKKPLGVLDKEIEKIEADGPYLNFFINKQKLAEHIININSSFGKQKQTQKIILEHTSVNPNASPHVGRTRNSIIGDSIYRILSFLGNKVERHYYVNDIGKQIAMLALVFKEGDNFNSLLERYIQITNKIEKNPELEKKVFDLLRKFEHKDRQTIKLFNKIADTAVSGQKKIFSSIGIEFDYFDYESRYIEHGKKILNDLEKTGKLFKDKENRFVLDLKDTPLIRKLKSPVMVLTRSDGTGLYVLRDLAYTIEKCKKGKNIIVLGEDQKVYFEQLREALKLLNKPYPEVIHYSFVLLKGIGKMSTRRGEVVLLEEFLEHARKKAKEEIKKRKTKGDHNKLAIAAVKYAMLRNENNRNIIFDLEQSLNFKGNTGPYLQYSYARASSIIRKFRSNKNKTKIDYKIKISESLTNPEISLLSKISKFPETIELASKFMDPSIIANYSYELAKVFNEFYHSCKVLGDKNEAFRLKLIDSFKITLKNSLYLLGIEVIEEM
ncbi:MAG: arginine--tRNA ligase [Nanoarchaeota archaeon]